MGKKALKFNSFIFLLLAVWIISDLILTSLDPLKYSGYFVKNDYEITCLKHPEKTWDKVLYGSSVVTASFIEEQSASGYYNVGVDYGTVSDIYSAIAKGKIDIGSDLVIALNDISFLDSLDTNPTYIWHKKWYQHYIFFERDKIYPLFEQGVSNLLHRQKIIGDPIWTDQEKTLYYGALSEEELEKSNQSMLERFGGCSLNDCRENFSALEKLIKICAKKNIRLRAVWMPWNPRIPVYDFAQSVTDNANAVFKENNIDVYDMTNMIDSQYFYDIGHMNYESGAAYFTQRIDEFLCK